MIDAQGRPVAGVVLSVAGQAQRKPAPVAIMDQLDKQFVPAVLAVATGTAVSFPNSDDIRHQVYSFSPAKRFELRLYEGTPSAPVGFDHPGLVVLGCNIHDWMLGYIYVTDDPWFGVSDAQGLINLDAPAGQYPATLWHPALVDMQPMDAGTLLLGEDPVELKLPVAVTAALQPSPPAATPFADAFRKATRDAQP
ncbi:methylamine utilization protein [Pseudomonas stutzeri]|nr:methylamine utilization protein [Stutzerimonas stutzeri]MCQ4251667.1 methylamine utilization protein [Stutzerimonas stutzeri]